MREIFFVKEYQTPEHQYIILVYRDGSVVEFDPLTKKRRVIYESESYGFGFGVATFLAVFGASVLGLIGGLLIKIFYG